MKKQVDKKLSLPINYGSANYWIVSVRAALSDRECQFLRSSTLVFPVAK